MASTKSYLSFTVGNSHVCDEHLEVYQTYCRIHDCACCPKCIFVGHKHCRDTVPLDDVICNVKESAAFQDLDGTLEELAENIQIIRKNREKEIENLTKTRELVENEIFHLRKQMNDHLNKLQDEIVLELYKKEEISKREIKKSIKLLTDAQNEITKFQSKFLDIKKCPSDLKAFLGMKRIEPGVTQNVEFVESFFENGKFKSINISLKADNVLDNFIANVTSIGEIATKAKHNEVNLVRKTSRQAQTRVIRVNPESIDNVKLKLERQVITGAKNIKGCATLEGDECTVFVSFNPSNVILVRNTGDIETIQLNTERSTDVTSVDERTLAVTSGSERSITIFDIKDKVSKKTIETVNPCDGVICKADELIYCARNIGLEKINMKDLTISSNLLPSKIGLFSYLAASGNNLYFTNSAKNTVTCCDTDGNTIWIFENESELKGPAGICADDRRHIYVAGTRSNNIVVISPDGKLSRQLLSREDNIYHPQALAYCQDTNQLVVCNAEGTALFYSVKIS